MFGKFFSSRTQKQPSRAARPYRPLLEQLEKRVLLSTFEVNRFDQDGYFDSDYVDSVDDQGRPIRILADHVNTLERAIHRANADLDTDTIVFNLPGVGPHVLESQNWSAWMITAPVVIDGTTAAGWSPSAPSIVLDTKSGGGLHIRDAGGCYIRGLTITSSVNIGYVGIWLDGGWGNNHIQGNFIGLDPTGSVVLPEGAYARTGIQVGSPNNVIGGTADDEVVDAAAGVLWPLGFNPGNVISMNDYGVFINGESGGMTTRIQGNYIGVDGSALSSTPTRVTAAPNDVGIYVFQSNANTIGGVGRAGTAGRNIISANLDANVLIEGTSRENHVEGNYIGTDATGTAIPTNADQSRVVGVLLDGASANTIGGPGDLSNLISGNDVGVEIFGGGANNFVIGNLIGTDVEGTRSVENRVGVYVLDSPGNRIGMSPAPGNVISGNTEAGIYIKGLSSAGNRVESNSIGLAKDGLAALGNRGHGVVIDNAPSNIIGGVDPLAGNFIAANAGAGIQIQSEGATDNTVAQNAIGTNKDTSRSVGNTLDGVVLFEAPGNRVLRNVVGGNQQSGVTIQGSHAKGNLIWENHIGVFMNADGRVRRLPNTRDGLFITLADDTIVQQNTISANGNNGIALFVGVERTVLVGNRIGTDPLGMSTTSWDGSGSDLGNLGAGVLVDSSSNNVIGNPGAGFRNVISGNAVGIHIREASERTTVSGNYIGTNAEGTSDLPNLNNGLVIDSSDENWIGEPLPDTFSNLISGNIGDGIVISGTSTLNRVEGNFIGTSADGISALKNTLNGVRIVGSFDNVIGGTHEAGSFNNLISGNGGSGIRISTGSTGNRVEGNWIGTQADGSNPLPNELSGVSIDASSGNFIGAADDTYSNVISGNGTNGILIIDEANDNRVWGNYIGTTFDGKGRLGNGTDVEAAGILISGSSSNVIGTDMDGTNDDSEWNVISGNTGFGIAIVNESDANRIHGNLIGTDITGNGRLSNTRSGVFITAARNNIIGGAGVSDVDQNIISGNDGDGIRIYAASRNHVESNLIGIGFDGAAIPNLGYGVSLTGGLKTTIGTGVTGVRNDISGNLEGGILIALSNQTTVHENLIGTTHPNLGAGITVEGSTETTINLNVIENNLDGVRIASYVGPEMPDEVRSDHTLVSDNEIRNNGVGVHIANSDATTVSDSLIQHNGDDGVRISIGARDTTIGPGNRIDHNAGAGVFIRDHSSTAGYFITGSTVSDNTKGDIVSPSGTVVGFPTSSYRGSVHIEATLHGTPGTPYRVEFFASSGPGVSGAGQGEVFLGSRSVVTDAAGDVSFRADFANEIPAGWFTTMTITGPDGNTSGFTPPMQVTPPPPPDEVSISDVTVAEGDDGETAFVFTVTRKNFTDATVTVQVDTADGTARVADGDYQSVNGLLLTFIPGGPLQQKVTVPVRGDADRELNETFTLNLTNISGAAIGKAGVATILNDDMATLSIGDVTQVEGHGGATAFTFPVTLTKPGPFPVSVQVDTADGTATVAAGDYASTSIVLTFNPGEPLTQWITVPVTGDTRVEADETFAVNLSQPTGGALIARHTATGTIGNDDAPAFSINSITRIEGAGETTAFSFTVNLLSSSDIPVLVQVDTVDGTASASDGDYTPLSGLELNFNPGAPLSQIVTVFVHGDVEAEPDESFTVKLSVGGLAAAMGTGTILNDDAAPFVVTTTADTVASDGVTSLREAILAANATPGVDNITFNIPGAGLRSIRLTSALPTITGPVVIDGYTQPGARPNTLEVGNDAVLLIELNNAGVASVSGNGLLTISAGNSTVRGLVINRISTPAAIALQTRGGNRIEGNFLGTDAAGSVGLGNSNIGALITIPPNSTDNTALSQVRGDYGVRLMPGSSGNVIGGANPAARNLIAAFGEHGVDLGFNSSGFPVSDNNVVQGNYIGTDASGTADLGNGNRGVSIASNFNLIGGTLPGAGNLISGNHVGVFIQREFGQGGSGNLVQGNLIGLDATGTRRIESNTRSSPSGIVLKNGASNNTIGGAVAGAGNVISGTHVSSLSGFQGHGIQVGGTANVVQGNFVGTDKYGTVAVPNTFGILIQEGQHLIGGPTAGSGNVISGNALDGIKIINGSSTNNRVEGNLIGTDASGRLALGNQGPGISLRDGTSGNFIGGVMTLDPDTGRLTGQGNLISGNGGDGVLLIDVNGFGRTVTGNLIQGNFIGTDVSGMNPLGNAGDGINVRDNVVGNVFGGTAPGLGNLISSNGAAGIEFTGKTSSGIISPNPNPRDNVVVGNKIGTDVTGSLPLSNAGDGILIQFSSNNTIGGPASSAANTIAFNGGAGIGLIDSSSFNLLSTGNALLGNSIFANGGLAIDLGKDGVTLNDLADTDVGPNRLQNHPILHSVAGGPTTSINGSLSSNAINSFRLEFFASAQADSSGHGEGSSFLGSHEVTTDAGGNASFSVTLPVALPLGRFITATATRLVDDDANPGTPLVADDTSEFSMAIQVAPPADTHLVISLAPDSGAVNVGDTAGFVLIVSNDGGYSAAGLSVSALLPAGLGNDITWQIDPTRGTPESFTITGAVGSQVLSLAPNVTELLHGQSVMVHLVGVISANDVDPVNLQGTLNITAIVDAVNQAAGDRNRRLSAEITLLAPDIAVSVAPDSASIDAGRSADLTVTISNVGPGNANGVTLSMPLPAGLTNAIPWTIDPTMGDPASFQITGALGSQVLTLRPSVTTLERGRQRTVRVEGLTSAEDTNASTLTEMLRVTATVQSVNEPAVVQNNQAEAFVNVNASDVRVSVVADRGAVAGGEVAGFTITVTNQGPGKAIGLALHDVLPGGPAGNLSWAIDTGSGNPDAFQLSGPADQQILSLVSGATTLLSGASLSVHVKALTSQEDAAVLNNTAVVTASNELVDSQNSQASAVISVVVPGADIRVTPDRSTISSGDVAGLTVTVTNKRPVNMVMLTMPLPAGTGNDVNWEIDPASTNASLFKITGGLGSQVLALANDIATLGDRQTVQVRVTGLTSPRDTAPTTLSGILSARATIHFGSLLADERSADATIVINSPNVQVAMAADRATINPGDTAGFTLMITNIGPGTAHQVTLADPLPGGVDWKIDPATGDPAAFQIDGALGSQMLKLSDSATSLASGAVLTVHITGVTPSGEGGVTLSHTATVNAVNERSEDRNDVASASITVVGQSGGPLQKGQTATIGFWQNKNGQAIINNFNGGSQATALGFWLASNFQNLFGDLAGKTNAEVATAYKSAFANTGLQATTYVQSFAVALAIYTTTYSLGGASTLANPNTNRFGFKITAAGAGAATFNVGTNGFALGVTNGTTLTLLRILQLADQNYDPRTRLFFAGNKPKTSALNAVLSGINEMGDI